MPPIPEAPTPEPRRAESQRTEPGTWREIIARFEHELGDVPIEAPDETPREARPTGAAAQEPPTGDAARGAAEPEEAPQQPVTPQPPTIEGADEEELEPLETAVPWEFEGMTTPDYTPPRSIHDPEHDSWPVEAEDGDAMPAWGAEGDEDVTTHGDVARHDEIGEMVLDQVVSPDPWDVDPDEAPSREREFPLNAFIVPAGVERPPGGYENGDVAQRVAHRLDELAQQLRTGGLGALGRAQSVDELSRVLAAIVTGYVSRDA